MQGIFGNQGGDQFQQFMQPYGQQNIAGMLGQLGMADAYKYGALQNRLGTGRQASAAEYAADQGLRNALIEAPYQLASTMASSIPAATANMYGSVMGRDAQAYSSYYPAQSQALTGPINSFADMYGNNTQSIAAQNIAQMNNMGKLTGLRETLAAILPMLNQQQQGQGPFPITTNYGAGVSWG